MLADREVTPQLGLLKSTLLQLDSTFSERDYGAGTFRDFIEKVAERGLVSLKQAGRSVLVELADNAVSAAVPDTLPAPVADVVAEAVASPRDTAAHDTAIDEGAEPRVATVAPTVGTEQALEAVQTASRLFAAAKQNPRWPDVHPPGAPGPCARWTSHLTNASSALPVSSSSCARARKKACCGSTAIGKACFGSSQGHSSRVPP